jgi:single-strand DNA-binding protein
MNKVILIGRLTKDPELRYTGNTNTAVASFTLAVDRRMKQEGQQSADFPPLVAWGKTAEFVNNYFKKGNKLGVCGRIQTRTWDGSDGKKNYVTEVVCEEAYFIEKQTGSVPQSSRGEAHDTPSGGYFPVDMDGDIPF